ncbi:sarcosine oxidase subunit gamma [Streptomyces sioyaensis]|uniref:Sarcosine oxidase subunit gamma n=1 Tax=Streptomyces sioyaensis TaxID=67364 RepID=A0A4Q1RBN9_9ACTN|nr:sarcosine oxidase subunit gamma family protein [Streptomyces sioyaensis]MBM4793731.1 sarcosine oxidase subunit gamma [Streptomyces sioyaensis]RXS70935.1 sarcosine oxidase subunit gamma [Streptomyces sioyaensis]
MTAEVTTPRARSPLHHRAHLLAAADVEGPRGVRLRELPCAAQVTLRLDPSSPAAARVAGALGLPALPVEPGGVRTAAGATERTVLWLGPDEWLVVGPEGDAPAIEAVVRDALGDGHGAVVDVSANRTTLEISGPCAREVLEKGCSLDLHPRAFGPGRCAQTLLARAAVILRQIDTGPTYHLLVRGSFAPYLADWLLDAMTEFRSPEVPR